LAVNSELHEKPKDSYLEGLIYVRAHLFPALVVAVFVVSGMAFAVKVLERLY
jgi:hypothetical protein